MAEEKPHHHLFESHKEEEEKSLSDDVALSGSSDAFDGGDYSSEKIGGRHSRAIDETDEKDEEDEKHKEHLGEIDTLAAADELDLYEKEETKKGTAQCCQKRSLGKEASTPAGVSPTDYAVNERREKKEAKEEEDDDEEDEEEAEGKKKEQLF